MPITQQKLPGVITSNPPAATSIGDQYLVAWTNNDTNSSIAWQMFDFTPSFEVAQQSDIFDTGFQTQPGAGPALTNFNGVVWMAFLENPAQAPGIPPYDQRQQPPVIMVSSFSASSSGWSSPQPLWNPGLVDNDDYLPGYQGPAAITAPALAANGSEMMAVWVEMAVDGSDALAEFSEGTLASPPASPTIFFAKYRSGGWSQRKAVKNALTQVTPALVAAGDGFYMAWQGESDDTIWFASYSDAKGWSDSAQLPAFETSAGPALAVDDAGDVQFVWRGKTGNDLYLATLAAGAEWSPDKPGKGWSPHIELPVIATSAQPALASQLGASDVLLAYKGATASDVWVVPLSAFALVPPPNGAFVSNRNYIFGSYQISLNNRNNCPSLKALQVTIEITEDMVVTGNSPAQGGGTQLSGCSFQLNCYSGPEPGWTGGMSTSGAAWQQFVVALLGNSLQCGINNWPTSGPYIYDTDFVGLTGLPNANVLPKGYQIGIELLIGSDAIYTGGIVNGAIFSIWDNAGILLVSLPQTIDLPAADVSPIVAFELNVVGPGNKESATMSSGAGTIRYASSVPLYTMNFRPACTETSAGTAETANISYRQLTIYPSETIKQSFFVIDPS